MLPLLLQQQPLQLQMHNLRASHQGMQLINSSISMGLQGQVLRPHLLLLSAHAWAV
jgi:hypothetical protein